MESEKTKTTCLNAAHRALGAEMVPFGGFDMPLYYTDIESEHRAVRTACGVFDVSHMGEVMVSGEDAMRFVNHIFTGDVSTLAVGDVVYGMMLHDNGGTVDDLLVYRIGAEAYLLVINASNIDKDVAHIRAQAAEFSGVRIEDISDTTAQLAVQGPDSPRIMAQVLDLAEANDLRFYTCREFHRNGHEILVSRTGYTGEDGFEIYGPQDAIIEMWNRLVAAGVTPCGLGCRDTLRFEAGLPLYGDELGDDISPIMAGLSMFVKIDKDGGFMGRDAVARQKAEGVKRRLVGLEIQGPAIARHGYEVLDADDPEKVIGTISTGYHSITLGTNLAMAFIDRDHAALGTHVLVRVRRKTFPATVVKKRFYTPNYKK